MVTRVPFKDINMMTKEQYNGLGTLAADSLYAISDSGISLPSNRYIDWTLGATGTSYTAPANGWLHVSKASTASNQYITAIHSTRQDIVWSASAQVQYLLSPCIKGEVVRVDYTVAGATSVFRFIYAEGE